MCNVVQRVLGAGLALALVLQVGAVGAAAADPTTDDTSTRLLVTYRAPVDGEAEAGAFSTASVIATGDPATPDASPSSAVQVLEFDGDRDAAAAARELRARPDVVSVEPDYPLYADSSIDQVLPLSAASSSSSSSSSFTTATGSEDPLLEPTYSWGVANDGSAVGGVDGRAGIDVGAAQVAEHATGKGVVVAVIDTGIDISHPLLRDKLWVNPGETVNGIDDDGNGFVDDIHGWDFANDRAEVFRDPAIDSHGTHVAGVIAGAPHSPTGFRGVAPGARIMALKFIDADAGFTSDAIAAIRYAVDNGADVINASWGGKDASQALRTAMAELDIPMVVSAGNAGADLSDEPSYPASFALPNVISVAAVDHTGALASFSSYSRDVVDVAAPGARILSAWPDSQLAIASGTSQAAPHVSGVLALALERHPGQDPVQLASTVRATVRPLVGVTDTRSGGIVRAPALLDTLGSRVPACASTDPITFTDVPASNVHRPAVACLVTTGVTKGISSTHYGSDQGLTRAQIATLVASALAPTGALPAAPTTGRFTDVKDTNVHRDAIETLGALGIVTGITATTYGPNLTVTRAELAAVTARADEYLADGEIRAAGPAFVDLAGVPEALEIDKSAGLRIVRGRSDTIFEPAAPVRRDQAASMVAQLLDRLVQQGLLAPV